MTAHVAPWAASPPGAFPSTKLTPGMTNALESTNVARRTNRSSARMVALLRRKDRVPRLTKVTLNTSFGTLHVPFA